MFQIQKKINRIQSIIKVKMIFSPLNMCMHMSKKKKKQLYEQ